MAKRGDQTSCVMFHVRKVNTTNTTLQSNIPIMTKEKYRSENKYGGKIITKSEKLYLQEKITYTEIYDFKKNISSHTEDNIEDHVRAEETSNSVGTSEEHIENKAQEKMQSSIQLEIR